MNRLHWEALEPEAREAFALVSRALSRWGLLPGRRHCSCPHGGAPGFGRSGRLRRTDAEHRGRAGPSSGAGAANGLPLANRDDIAATKLSAIANRGSRKDFVDLWVLMTRHRPLAEYLALHEEKFEARDVGHVIRSLIHFDDAEREPPLRLLIELDWEELKADFRRRVAALW